MEILLAWMWAPQKIHYNIPPSLFWLLWLGFAALMALMLYAKSRQVRKRREELEQLAMQNGFVFSAKPD